MQQRRSRLGVFLKCVLACGLGACGDGAIAGPAPFDGGLGLSDADAALDGAAAAPDAAPFVCDVVAPTECPDPSPTYQTVQPIIEARCIPCHDGRGEQWPLTDYGDVTDWYDSIRTMVLDCTMPPQDAGIPMPTSEREHLLTWIRCGYPE